MLEPDSHRASVKRHRRRQRVAVRILRCRWLEAAQHAPVLDHLDGRRRERRTSQTTSNRSISQFRPLWQRSVRRRPSKQAQPAKLPTVASAADAAPAQGARAAANDPDLRLAQAREQGAFSERLRRFNSPGARAGRKRSRSRYRNLSTRAARQLAQRAFAGDLTAPLGGGLDLAPGDKLKGYLTDNTAKITSETGPGAALIQSMLPLRTADESGVKKPVELGLIRDGGHLESLNPLIPVSYGDKASEALSFPDSGVSIAPSGVNEEVKGVASNDRLFYPEVAADVDFVTVPLPVGAEASWIIRSADAPEEYRLKLSASERPPRQHHLGSTMDDHRLLQQQVLHALPEPVLDRNTFKSGR